MKANALALLRFSLSTVLRPSYRTIHHRAHGILTAQFKACNRGSIISIGLSHVRQNFEWSGEEPLRYLVLIGILVGNDDCQDGVLERCRFM
jgi:hypothetical protein